MAEAMGEKEEKVKQGAGVPTKEDSAVMKKPHGTPASKKHKKTKEVRISEKELGELKEKASLADDYFDRLLRLQADFENFRKRKEKERLDLIKYATGQLVSSLVPILSNFERALAAAEKVPQVKGFVEGVEIILKELKKLLKEHGMEEICPVNAPFDPYKHEAVEKVITDDHPEGHIVEVLQKGYALNDIVLQHAAVKVAVSPETEQEESAAPGPEEEGSHPEETTETEISQDKIEEGKENG
ncbi:nucleotide exchange factor GrpE [bacterium]|nr:nucleotide exchange factor GrpE [bacterium]